MYDTPQVDERYTDQARIHVKVIGNDRLHRQAKSGSSPSTAVKEQIELFCATLCWRLLRRPITNYPSSTMSSTGARRAHLMTS